MPRIGQLFTCLVLLFVSSDLAQGAEVSPEVRRAAALTTAAEAALTTTSLLKDRNPWKATKAGWSIRFSDRNWVLTIRGGGDEFFYTMTGFIWGGDTEDWLVSYSGLGTNGKESIFINGKGVWKYDRKLADHTTMDFDNIVKFGENSSWGWTRGAQVVVGGAIGTAAGILAGGAGAGPAGAIVLGIGGAMGGISGAVTISDLVKEFVESRDPVPPTTPPKVPSIPQNEQLLPPAKDMIVVAVLKDGTIRGTGPNETLSLSGSFKEGNGTGIIEVRSTEK